MDPWIDVHGAARNHPRMPTQQHLLVKPSGTDMPTKDDLVRRLQDLVHDKGADGYVRHGELMKVVPARARDEWVAGDRVRLGQKWVFVDADGAEWTVRFHEMDRGAAGQLDHTHNVVLGWTAQIEGPGLGKEDFPASERPDSIKSNTKLKKHISEVGHCHLDQNGQFLAARTENSVHIPIIFE